MIESIAEKEIEEDTWDGSVRTLKKFIDNGIKKQMIKMDEKHTTNSKSLQEL